MKILLWAFLVCVTAGPVWAAEQEPVNISADGTLEWHRNDKQYVANSNVVVTQGDVTLTADRVVADYRDDTGSPKLYQFTATGHVVITSGKDNTATGDKAVYNLDTKSAVMTGQNLTFISPEQTVTAKDHFEYWTDEGRVVAVGDAVVKDKTNTLAADTVTAWMAKDANGKQALSRAEGVGNVVITTPTEKATGSKVTYEKGNDTAVLLGPVKITRNKDVLTGARASVNLKTNVSTIYGDDKGGARVKGTFYTAKAK